jgi:hypothetical protein
LLHLVGDLFELNIKLRCQKLRVLARISVGLFGPEQQQTTDFRNVGICLINDTALHFQKTGIFNNTAPITSNIRTFQFTFLMRVEVELKWKSRMVRKENVSYFMLPQRSRWEQRHSELLRNK